MASSARIRRRQKLRSETSCFMVLFGLSWAQIIAFIIASLLSHDGGFAAIGGSPGKSPRARRGRMKFRDFANEETNKQGVPAEERPRVFFYERANRLALKCFKQDHLETIAMGGRLVTSGMGAVRTGWVVSACTATDSAPCAADPVSTAAARWQFQW